MAPGGNGERSTSLVRGDRIWFCCPTADAWGNGAAGGWNDTVLPAGRRDVATCGASGRGHQREVRARPPAGGSGHERRQGVRGAAARGKFGGRPQAGSLGHGRRWEGRGAAAGEVVGGIEKWGRWECACGRLKMKVVWVRASPRPI
jgi:hypothetical protein